MRKRKREDFEEVKNEEENQLQHNRHDIHLNLKILWEENA
jgi:hypothetical protein